jgi:hypothetical protein
MASCDSVFTTIFSCSIQSSNTSARDEAEVCCLEVYRKSGRDVIIEFNRFEEVGIGQNRSKANVSTRECVEKDDLRRRASYEWAFWVVLLTTKKKEDERARGRKILLARSWAKKIEILGA